MPVRFPTQGTLVDTPTNIVSTAQACAFSYLSVTQQISLPGDLLRLAQSKPAETHPLCDCVTNSVFPWAGHVCQSRSLTCRAKECQKRTTGQATEDISSAGALLHRSERTCQGAKRFAKIAPSVRLLETPHLAGVLHVFPGVNPWHASRTRSHQSRLES